MANDTDGRSARGGDSAAALTAPVLVPLPELGVIAAGGPDTVAFLQSQLTGDVAQLAPDALALNGYCTAKGRLLATFHVWRDGDELLLRLPREILPAVLKRLQMFVLRAKVQLRDASERWTTHGLLGAVPGAPLPSTVWTAHRTDGAVVARVPAAPEAPDRYLISAAAEAALPAWCEGLPRADAQTWWWSEIAAAVPTVFAATQEKFVPQMINYEVLGGVSFRKGCYPGQEVVARSQYLGKLKRRMSIAHVPGDAPPAGADVYAAGAAQPVGTVVMAAPSPAGGTDLLFEVPIDRLASGTLHAGAPDGPPLAVRDLPYALFDPTA